MTALTGTRPPKVLAIASGGGHWVQLMRLLPAWDGCRVAYATTTPDFREIVTAEAARRGQPAPEYFLFTEANRWQKMRLARQFAEIAAILARFRPDTVITTGAAAGYFALRLARLSGARTAWIDSIANAGEMSLSGRKSGPHADLWLTQWPELAEPGGPDFEGAVL